MTAKLGMYDFRQKRRSSAASSRVVTRPKKVVAVVRRKRPSTSRRARQRSQINRRPLAKPSSLLTALGSMLVGVAVIAICIYFFITKLAASIWTLDTPQTILLVPPVSADQSLPFVQVAVLDPSLRTVQLVKLSGNVPLSVTGDVTVNALNTDIQAVTSSHSGAISLKLGRVIDEVVTLPTTEPITTHSQAKRTFQALIGQDTPAVPKATRFKWWLFLLSISDIDFRVKEVSSYSAWEVWLATVAQQQSVACSLAVINTTETSGLSRFMSQIMEQSGYQVIRVDSQPKFLSNSQLFLNPQRLHCLPQAERLQQFLPTAIEIVPDLAATQQARADIVWLLGSDVAGPAGQIMRQR